ncbi:MAG: hypothetical protein UX39_C0003G0032 [Candidatus Magasanikbacteria bacterium GW2011_GWA2_46_17]|uniref:Uncharacterized protein n=2 Tax=Parcubacteria group TaxID=1794811 RepID=A0A0G1RB06_9BACT|nr:MAG: hypothetical protein UX39_C0003G0032 [Candidatus Magasanikbacteria bacterium GW2011_GWA2_46_17]OGG60981.1 MAG: hypothetical protein A3C86_04505 [Candidatus Kaiserbacteria bacterium RIFCSPHIGHO2_02_FULL_49_16]
MIGGYELVANSLSSIPLDWMVIVGFGIILAFIVMRTGISRAVALALSLPVALLIFSELTQARFLAGIGAQLGTPIMKALVFIIPFVVIYYFVHQMIDTYGSGNGAITQALLASIATVVVVVVVWLQVPELQSLWHFGSQIQSIFDEQYRFWWLVCAYSTLAFVR